MPGEHIADFRVNGPSVLGIPRGHPGPEMRLRVSAHEIPADHAAHLVVADTQGQRVAALGLRMTALLTLLRYSSEVQQPQPPAAPHAAPHGLPGSLYDLQ